MPVWVATKTGTDIGPGGKQRRHIDDECPVYVKVPAADRCPPKGTPNTTRLQERTERCEHPECWAKWAKEQADKPKRGGGGGAKTTRGGAAKTAPIKQGGDRALLAAKAAAARQKPKAAAAKK